MNVDENLQNTLISKKLGNLNSPFIIIQDPHKVTEEETEKLAKQLNAEIITINDNLEMSKGEERVELLRQELKRCIIWIGTDLDLLPHQFISIQPFANIIKISKVDILVYRLKMVSSPEIIMSDQFIDELKLLEVDLAFWGLLTKDPEDETLNLAKFIIYLISGSDIQFDTAIEGVTDSLLVLNRVFTRKNYSIDTRETIRQFILYFIHQIEKESLQEEERTFLTNSIKSIEERDLSFLQREVIYQIIRPIEETDRFVLKSVFDYCNWDINQILNIRIPDNRFNDGEFVWKHFSRILNLIIHLINENVSVLRFLKEIEASKKMGHDDYLSSLDKLIGLTEIELDLFENSVYDFAITRMNSLESLDVLTKANLKIKSIFKYFQSQKAVLQVENRLKHTIKIIQYKDAIARKNPQNWIEWCELIENQLIPLDLSLNFLFGNLPSNQSITLNPILKDYEDKKSKLLENYEYFFLNHIKIIISKGNETKFTVSAIPNILCSLYQRDRIPILLVIDGISLNLYNSIREAMIERGFISNSNYKSHLTSFIPSETHFARRGLFSGKNQVDLINFSKQTGIKTYDEPALLARACGFQEDEIAYTVNLLKFKSKLEDVLNGKKKIVALVYRFIDKLAHFFEDDLDIQLDTIKPLFDSLFDRHLAGIANNRKVSVVITADHGSIQTKFSQKHLNMVKELKNETYANAPRFLIDLHPRYFLLSFHSYPRLQTLSPMDKWAIIRTKLGNNFVLIPGNELPQYGLSKYQRIEGTLKPIDILAFVPKDFSLFSRIDKSFQHGGLSFYETIVPLEVFEYNIEEIKPLNLFSQIDLTSYEKSMIFIEIINPNTIPGKELNLTITGLGKEKLVEFPKIKSKGTISTSFSVGPFEKGKKQVAFILSYKCGGKSHSHTFYDEITIKPSRREKMKIDRSLPEGW